MSINKLGNDNPKEKKAKMLEDLTVQAAQTLLTLFWFLLTIIILTAIATTRTTPKTQK